MEVIKGILGVAMVIGLWVLGCMFAVLPLLVGFWMWNKLLG